MEPFDDPVKDAPLFWQQKLQAYRVPLILGGVSILLIAVAVVLLAKSMQSATPIEFSRADGSDQSVLGVSKDGSASANTGRGISVDMEGAVVHPGVYKVAIDSRVEDGIQAAGGLSSDADAAAVARSINRAAKLVDGAKVYIPKHGDNSETSHNYNVQRDGVSTSHIVGSVGEAGSTVNVNSASQSELESLPGVGPVTAGKIIAGRPYMSLDQLVSKKAMSQSLFNKLKDQLSL